MSNISSENVCRCCLTEKAELVSIFQNNYSKTDCTLCHMIMAVASVQISSEDRMPDRICSKCARQIKRFYLFKLKIENSDKILRKQIPISEPNDNFLVPSYNLFTLKNEDFQIKEENDICFDNNAKECFSENDKYSVSQSCDVKIECKDSSEDDVKHSPIEDNFSSSESQSSIEESIKEEDKDSREALDNVIHRQNESKRNTFEHQRKTLKVLKKRQNKENRSNQFQKKMKFKCDECQKQFIYERGLATHVKKEHANPFKCDKCKASYCEEELLKKHIDEKHVCTICNKKFSSMSVHLRYHTGEKPYLCLECGKGFNQQGNLDEHILRHKGVKPFPCNTCEMRFIRKSKLNRHLKKCNNKKMKFKCDECQKQFIYERGLAKHVKKEHTNPFKCDKCKVSYCEEELLRKHIDDKHICTICNKKVSSISVHLRYHTGEKPFLCPECGKGFNQQGNLDEHILRHKGVKPFPCDTCEMRFITKSKLNRHLKKHSESKDYQCDVCGAMFTRKYRLNAHRDVKHFGIKKHECEICHKNFVMGEFLKTHMLSHSGEKPHSCTFCSKAFALKPSLKAHIRTHTGEKPYVCNTCGQAFGQRWTLQSHKEKENHS